VKSADLKTDRAFIHEFFRGLIVEVGGGDEEPIIIYPPEEIAPDIGDPVPTHERSV
jgi:hypothetical protein